MDRAGADRPGTPLHDYSGYTISVCQLRPESRGDLTLRDADPTSAPRIRANYLATETDQRTMIDGFHLIRRVMHQPAMRPYLAEETIPGADVTFAIESGVIGGLPASGVYFGAALCPRAIHSSAQVFRQWSRHLDATCLGALQVDSLGNVNVSRRGDGPRHYVGPGGFIDLTAAARVIVFVSPWMVHGEPVIADGRLRIARAGAPKFVERVDEITFDAARALAAGKRVFYATHVGLFRLTGRGVELAAVMPGIDVRRDILGATPMRILRPRSGRVPLLPTELLDGGASLVAMR